MPRTPRIEFEGAVYHVMSRGDHGEAIFQDDTDRQRFLNALADACGKTGWVVHAYVLMPNHYHLLIETPQANLVDGMKWLQGTYTTRYNHRHDLHGHLFQGRYKPLLIEPGNDAYFLLVSTYIHLNPVRAGMVAPDRRAIERYAWSSFPAYIGRKGRSPAWLGVDRVLASLDLADTSHGRGAYADYVAEQARQAAGGAESDDLQRQWKAIRRGWCLGSDAFRTRMGERLRGVLHERQAGSFLGLEVHEHQRHTAEQLLAIGLAAVGLAPEQLPALPKTDPRKQAVAWLIRKNTTVRNAWVSKALSMGHEVNVSQAVCRVDQALSPEISRLKAAVEKQLGVGP